MSSFNLFPVIKVEPEMVQPRNGIFCHLCKKPIIPLVALNKVPSFSEFIDNTATDFNLKTIHLSQSHHRNWKIFNSDPDMKRHLEFRYLGAVDSLLQIIKLLLYLFLKIQKVYTVFLSGGYLCQTCQSRVGRLRKLCMVDVKTAKMPLEVRKIIRRIISSLATIFFLGVGRICVPVKTDATQVLLCLVLLTVVEKSAPLYNTCPHHDPIDAK